LTTVSAPSLRIPAPFVALPPEIVSPMMDTVFPALILNTRLALLPLTVILSPLLFLIVMFFVAGSSPDVSVIVCGPAPARLNVMVVPLHTCETASRSEPAPASAVLVTIGFGVQALTVWATTLLCDGSKFPSPE